MPGGARAARLSSPIVLVLAFLVACGGRAEAPDPFHAEFENARRIATSEFERSVLEDSKITRAEYEEAVNRFIRCMRDGGIEAEALLSDAGYYTYRWPKGTAETDKVQDDCGAGTTRVIEPLYNEILVNPQNEDPFKVRAECLTREKVAPSGYTAEDLKRDIKTEYRNAPFERDDPRVQACMTGRH